MRDLHKAVIQAAVETIDPRRLQQHVATIAGYGPRSVDDAAAVLRTLSYCREQLRDSGYTVIEERFGDALEQINLLARRRGMLEPERVLELGAHYDTVRRTPGADDNASGVAGVLEVARVVSGLRLQRTLRFCLFGGEESGLTGSTAHAQQVVESEDERVEGILVFEMIGFRTSTANSQTTPVRIPLLLWPPRTGDFIAVISDFRSRRLAIDWERAARRWVPGLQIFPVKRIGGWFRDAARSDHVPYWRLRRKGVMITDTANFRNPNYHKPTDLPETLDYDFAADVARATLAMMLEDAGVQ